MRTKHDYWRVFKICVNHLKIAPSEAWKLDIVDVIQLLDQDDKTEIDTSIMLNYQRISNGASKSWLHSKG